MSEFVLVVVLVGGRLLSCVCVCEITVLRKQREWAFCALSLVTTSFTACYLSRFPFLLEYTPFNPFKCLSNILKVRA